MMTVRSVVSLASSISITSWLRRSTMTPVRGPGPNAAANTSLISSSESDVCRCFSLVWCLRNWFLWSSSVIWCRGFKVKMTFKWILTGSFSLSVCVCRLSLGCRTNSHLVAGVLGPSATVTGGNDSLRASMSSFKTGNVSSNEIFSGSEPLIFCSSGGRELHKRERVCITAWTSELHSDVCVCVCEAGTFNH